MATGELFTSANEKLVSEIIRKQQAFFSKGQTLDYSFRLNALNSLYRAIKRESGTLAEAVKKDLGKSDTESAMCEISLALSEISYLKKHLKSFMKPRYVHTPIAHFPSLSKTISSPYGNVLIISPWNYPVLLTLEPLSNAISAGNTAVIKPSAYAPNVSKAIKGLIEQTFGEEYVAVIEGGREENSILLNAKFDYIFFTGSKTVGKTVMQKASEHLTPVTLELGGKSPCIVLQDAALETSARRIVFGKYLNAGQTCVAPDYILIDKSIKKEFIDCVIKEINKQFTSSPLTNDSYGKIISEKHFNRLCALIENQKVIYGGKSDKKTLKIEPTVIDEVTLSDPVMQEEIFGPIMPIIEISSQEEAMDIIRSLAHPLALYVFTKNKKAANSFINNLGFGGGCINDTVVHLATPFMPFGGFGESGMGSYHGKSGFDAFSHKKSILDKKLFLDLPIRYQPYTKTKRRLIDLFLK